MRFLCPAPGTIIYGLYPIKGGQAPTKDQAVQVRLEGETVWLTQTQMAELFGTVTDNISLHLKNVYASEELEEIATTEDFSVVR